MKNYCILKHEGNEESKQSLQILVNQKLQVIIWSDGLLTFMPEIDYEIEELAYFIKIGQMFYSFFNNLKV